MPATPAVLFRLHFWVASQLCAALADVYRSAFQAQLLIFCAVSFRFRTSIGVGELMYYFDATHQSVNAAPASDNELQSIAKQTEEVETVLLIPPASHVQHPQVTPHLGAAKCNNCCLETTPHHTVGTLVGTQVSSMLGSVTSLLCTGYHNTQHWRTDMTCCRQYRYI